jgi:hypothetical protein
MVRRFCQNTTREEMKDCPCAGYLGYPFQNINVYVKKKVYQKALK